MAAQIPLKDVCCFELSAPRGAGRGDTEDTDDSSALANNYPFFLLPPPAL